MKKLLFKTLTVALFIMGFALPSHAETNDIKDSTSKKVEYDYTQSGTTYQLARIALRDKIFDLEGQINRKIIVFTAREDLNGDRVPEIFVKLDDKKFFCSEDEGCDTYILAVSEDGPVKIGEMKADDIYIEQDRHNNASILTASRKSKKTTTTYIFEDGMFVEKNAEETKKETTL